MILPANPRELLPTFLWLVSLLLLGGLRTNAQTAVEAWAQRYDGPGHADDQARAVTVDASGNIIVTGFSVGSGGNQDYVTVAGQFRDPDRLAFDPSGTLLYVSEWGNNRVQVFNYNVPPQMISAATRSGSEITLSWHAIPGRRYQVQYKADLTQANWINLGSSFVATNSIVSVADAVVFDAQRFYRISLLP